MKNIRKIALLFSVTLLFFTFYTNNLCAKEAEEVVKDSFNEVRGGYYSWSQSGPKIASKFSKIYRNNCRYEITNYFKTVCQSISDKYVNKNKVAKWIDDQKREIKKNCPNLIPALEEYEVAIYKVVEQLRSEEKKS